MEENGGLTSVHLPFHGIHASRLLDDVVDELGGFLISHLSFSNPSLREQLPQIRVDVVGIPADVSDVSDRDETMMYEQTS